MSLRQRHIDPHLALSSQRLVEGSPPEGQQGEGASHPGPPRPRPAFRESRSQSFGHLESLCLPPLSSAVSHPAIICSSSSSSSVAPHSSHLHQPSFQPMDPIPDLTFSDDSEAHSARRDSFGYPSPRGMRACGRSAPALTNASRSCVQMEPPGSEQAQRQICSWGKKNKLSKETSFSEDVRSVGQNPINPFDKPLQGVPLHSEKCDPSGFCIRLTWLLLRTVSPFA